MIFTKIKKILYFLSKVILYSLLIILSLLILLIGIYYVDNIVNIKTGKYNQAIYDAYIIISGSMEPKIEVYDVVINKRVDVNDLEVGDVITFVSTSSNSTGLTITHRIVGLIEDSKTGKTKFRTKGDNNFSVDESLVTSDNVIGKVILVIPKVGYIRKIILDNIGLLAILVLICLIIVIKNMVFNTIKLVKQKTRKNM